MKIGIMGTGIVGRSHAEKLTELGHEVMIGTRSVEKTMAEDKPDGMGNVPFRDWHKSNQTVKLGTFDEAARFGEIVYDVLRGEVAVGVFASLDKESLSGKIVVDIANALDFSQGMPPLLLVHDGNSLGEQLQKAIPGAKVVKTLNTVSAQLQTNPMMLNDGDHQVFMSGNDPDAKKSVEAILRSYGWKNILDLGDITTARGTELLMPMWLRLWGALGTPLFNYKIIK
ncbi:NAD(P)-binding domain-containing protein [Candidatus Falkowbacteria bacterium]|nr:NAD(P)-binding domain-containing protein [Candidatus Falkowbacteria bacterium]